MVEQADHVLIADEPISAGTRVAIHSVLTQGFNNTVVRVPHNPDTDDAEIQAANLVGKYFPDFVLPKAIVAADVRGRIRNLIQVPRVSTGLTLHVLSASLARWQLRSQKNFQDKMAFLERIRLFVNACKRFFYHEYALPDLMGTGNVIVSGTDIQLLDTNNVVSERPPFSGLYVPLDDKQLPIFDGSLDILYRIEKLLLTHSGGNFSVPEFSQQIRRELGISNNNVPRPLEGTLVERGGLKADPFYGALRFRERREKVRALLARHQRSRWGI